MHACPFKKCVDPTAVVIISTHIETTLQQSGKPPVDIKKQPSQKSIQHTLKSVQSASQSNLDAECDQTDADLLDET